MELMASESSALLLLSMQHLHHCRSAYLTPETATVGEQSLRVYPYPCDAFLLGFLTGVS